LTKVLKYDFLQINDLVVLIMRLYVTTEITICIHHHCHRREHCRVRSLWPVVVNAKLILNFLSTF